MGTRIGTLSATGLRVVLATAALLAVGATVGTTPSSADQTAAPSAPAIDCGGYAADGQLLRPAATVVTHARVEDGRLTVPATCGGYTDDGEFIGDD